MNSNRKVRHQLKVPRRAQGRGIIAQCMMGYEIADDGEHCRFSFVDGEGLERSLVLSLERMRQLFLTLQDILEHRAGACEVERARKIAIRWRHGRRSDVPTMRA